MSLDISASLSREDEATNGKRSCFHGLDIIMPDERKSSSTQDSDEEDEEDCYEYVESDDESILNFKDMIVDDDSLRFNVDPLTCPICYSRADSGEAIILTCRHAFCIECFQNYIQAQEEEGKANRITCPYLIEASTFCGVKFEPTVFQAILDNDEMNKLKRLSESAFVMESTEYQYCPTPDCDNVIYYKDGPPIVDCFKCKRVSCLKCGASPFHIGLDCDEWKARRDEGSERLSRALSRTIDRQSQEEQNRYTFETVDASETLTIRTCRRCGNGIEKAFGCNLMMCRCGLRFCYECGSENGMCDCTPNFHRFIDRGDFVRPHLRLAEL